MCGIVGFVKLTDDGLWPEYFLEQACAVIQHRGPDDQGVAYLAGGSVGLGMRRLSIIDLSTGNQPMFSPDGKITIVFNGEIYNYIELRDQLLALGCTFSTTSDTEVLLRAYEVYGVDCLKYLNGMFGFAIWDENKQQLFIARDRFGEKPIYYYRDHRGMVFGSELKSLLCVPFVPRVVDPRALDYFLSWLAVPDPDTMFHAVHKLPPAHYMLMNANGDVKIERYWTLSYPETPTYMTQQDAQDRLLDHLQQALKIRLRADVPLGILLSGGVDSSALVALSSRENLQALHTFSVGFDINGFNEFQYSRAVAERYNTHHTEVCMRAEDYWQMTEEAVWHLDEPMADTASVALMHICKIARGSVKVLLSGEGSDEMLAGYYGRYTQGRDALGPLPLLSEFLPPDVRQKVWQKYGGGVWPGNRKKAWQLSRPFEYQFLKSSIYGYYEGLREELYVTGFMNGYQPNEAELFHKLINGGRTPLQRMTYVDTVFNLPSYLLQKADKMSMAASVELRAPFLDHTFAEFCATIPDEYKLDRKQQQGKLILKNALRGLLPDDVLFRPKMGFPVPIDAWLRDLLKEQVADTILYSNARIHQFLNKNHIQNMWNAHQNQSLIFGLQLWQLTLLELWMQRFDVGVAA